MEPRDDALKQAGETEPQPENAYEEAVAFVKDSKDHFNDMQLRVIINDNFLDAIIKQAEAGEVTTRQVNAAGQEEVIALTPKALILDQFNQFIQLHDAHNPKAFNVIPRVGGLRDAMYAIAEDNKLAEPLKLAIMERQVAMMREKQGDVDVPIEPGTLNGIMNESHPVTSEVMSDQEREEVVEELGEQATETVVDEPSQAAAAARRLVGEENPYDAWLRGEDRAGSTEDAAVRPQATPEELLARRRRKDDLEEAADKAYLQQKAFKRPE